MRPKIKVAGHAVQGRGHTAKNVVCQDKVHVCRFHDKRSAIIALADGAGSCPHSHLGAGYVVSQVGKIIHQGFNHFFLNPENAGAEIVANLQDGLRSLAISKNIPIRSLSSTLLFVYVRRGRKQSRFIAGHIGDGVIGVFRGGGISVLSHPENGDFANSTYFLTSSAATDHLRMFTGFVQGNAGFLLLSDGAAESLYQKRLRTLAPACQVILGWFDRHPQQKVKRIIQRNLERVFRELTHDDCSIAALRITGIERICKRRK